jgi:hypothetical protein
MSEQGNVASDAGANGDVRPDAGAGEGTTLSVSQATAGSADQGGTPPPAQTSGDAGSTGAPAPAQSEASAAAGQEQKPASPLRGPLATASTPSPSPGEGEASVSWPDNWKEAAAAGDPAVAKMLERFADPSALAKSLAHAQATLRSKGQLQAPGPDATDEERTAYAELTGIPLAPADYKVELAEGRQIAEADKPFVDAFLEHAHKTGMNSAQVSAALDYWQKVENDVVAYRQQQDAEFGQKSIAALQEKWGTQFQGNLARISNMMAGEPEGFAEMIYASRTADGKLLGDHPEVLRFFLERARDENPVPTNMGGGTPDLTGLQGRKAEIQKLMGDPDSDYWRGPKSQLLKNEYEQLLRDEERYGGGLKRAA